MAFHGLPRFLGMISFVRSDLIRMCDVCLLSLNSNRTCSLKGQRRRETNVVDEKAFEIVVKKKKAKMIPQALFISIGCCSSQGGPKSVANEFWMNLLVVNYGGFVKTKEGTTTVLRWHLCDARVFAWGRIIERIPIRSSLNLDSCAIICVKLPRICCVQLSTMRIPSDDDKTLYKLFYQSEEPEFLHSSVHRYRCSFSRLSKVRILYWLLEDERTTILTVVCELVHLTT